MAKNSKIEWTDATWNPVTGCTKVSTGCKHCYAKRGWARLSGNKKTAYYDRKFNDVQCHEDRLTDPLRWRKPRFVFVNSMSDLFHEDVPDEFIDRIFHTMALADQHTFQVLTKRPGRMLETAMRWERNGGIHISQWPAPLKNVWMGISIENAKHLDRMKHLRHTPAAVRFVSFEPLLSDMGVLDLSGIHWVIIGGESGPKARPMHPNWVRSIRDQCIAAKVPFFFKQGSNTKEWPDFKNFDSFPNDLQIREYPDAKW